MLAFRRNATVPLGAVTVPDTTKSEVGLLPLSLPPPQLVVAIQTNALKTAPRVVLGKKAMIIFPKRGWHLRLPNGEEVNATDCSRSEGILILNGGSIP